MSLALAHLATSAPVRAISQDPDHTLQVALPYGVVAVITLGLAWWALRTHQARRRARQRYRERTTTMAQRGEFEADARGFSAIAAATSNVFTPPLGQRTSLGELLPAEQRLLDFQDWRGYEGHPGALPPISIEDRDIEHLALLGVRSAARHKHQRNLAAHLAQVSQLGWWCVTDVELHHGLLADAIIVGPRAIAVIETRGRDFHPTDVRLTQQKALLLYNSLTSYVQPVFALVVLVESQEEPKLWTETDPDDGRPHSAVVLGAPWLATWLEGDDRGGVDEEQMALLRSLGSLTARRDLQRRHTISTR